MKTVLYIDSAGRRYFRRQGGRWLPVDGPGRGDVLLVLANLAEESVEVIDLPRLSAPDRGHFIERRLNAALPGLAYRAAHIPSRPWARPGKAVLTGLPANPEIADALAAPGVLVKGLWGIAALLAGLAGQVGPPDLLVALPGDHELRILAIKDRLPLLTRCVPQGGGGQAEEILLTRQYLEHQRLFARGFPPPVLFWGDASREAPELAAAGIEPLPLPRRFLPSGEAGWLAPFLDYAAASPPCQLAPLPVRARYLARNIRQAAYAGTAATLVTLALYGNAALSEIRDLRRQERERQDEIQRLAAEEGRLASLVTASGADPDQVRQATGFAARELDGAPDAGLFLRLAAAAIAKVPAARVRTLACRQATEGESLCPGAAARTPGLRPPAGTTPVATGTEATAPARRRSEIRLDVSLPQSLSPQAQGEARALITTALKGIHGLRLLYDPTTTAGTAAITGGAATVPPQGEGLWCASIPWPEDDADVAPPASQGEVPR